MLYNRNNLVLGEICPSNAIRPELGGVLFKKDKTIATDSYVLLQVKNPKEMLNNAEELPETADKTKPLTNYPKKGYIVPKTAVKKVLSNIPSNPSLEIIKNCWFVQSKTPESVSVKATDLENDNIVHAKHIDSEYPNTDNVLPKSGYGHKITVRLKLLKKMVDTLNKMDLKGDNEIELSIKDANSPIKIESQTKDHQEVLGLIMPVRT